MADLIINRAKEADVILLYGAEGERFNNAVALKEYIEMKGSKIDKLRNWGIEDFSIHNP